MSLKRVLHLAVTAPLERSESRLTLDSTIAPEVNWSWQNILCKFSARAQRLDHAMCENF